ncbi:MAG TPA: D-aminoacylase [Gemmatimonadaceae bacterium]|nr:D-aminoacylase [Gemmatimonadaceae bacterium]
MTTRRTFLQGTAAALAAACARPAPTPVSAVVTPGRADVVLRGGTVFDGGGAAPIEADVAITGGRISAIGQQLATRGADEVDVRGLAVAPGFVDIHSHGDGSLSADPRAASVVRQGITTIVAGQDGGSRAPSRGDGPQTMAEALAAIDALQPAVNVASMVGLGTVRGAVVGDDDRPATAQELARMVAIVRQALADGACGASSGLEYTPGAFASQDELIALCRPLAERRLPYATHMRNEDDRLMEAVNEAIAVASGAGCPLQISHLKTQGPRNWPKIDAVLARIEAVKASGLDVAFDRYPYIAYQTGLSNLFPASSRDGGTAAFLARLADPATGAALRAQAAAKAESIGGWDHVMITSVRAEEDKAAEGQRLGAYALSVGVPPDELTVQLLTRSGGSVGMVGFAMSEENLVRFLAHPLGMVCSDGGAFATEGPSRRGHPHPRGLGSFPRVLGHFVRETRALTLEEAVWKMSGFPASRLALADRGRLRVGAAGDVVVFDPATVADRATFTDPFQYPIGIPHVLVNGAFAVRDGDQTARRTGKAVRPGARNGSGME